MAYAFYTRPRGTEMLSIEERWSRSDTVDAIQVRWSSDNGRTWTDAGTRIAGEHGPQGMLRRHPRAGLADAPDRYVEFWNEGTLASDDPLEGLRQWNIYYHVSRDGGRTFGPPVQVIHEGSEFHSLHPLPGVWTGKNCVMLGDVPCVPVALADGTILLPVEITPLAPDGTLYNPAGAYTYTDVAVVRGRWRGGTLYWRMSELVRGDPNRATRGMDEGTVEALDGGRLLMVMRGSNDRRPELPGYRWFTISADGGSRWEKPRPWTYQGGEPFFSPSSCSQLLRHSSGRLFWLGNVTPGNPRGNRPRYPFVIGEVDRRGGLLLRDSVRTVDTLQPGEDPILTLSNFFAREDRVTGEIAIHMTRLFARTDGWTGDAYLYRVQI